LDDPAAVRLREVPPMTDHQDATREPQTDETNERSGRRSGGYLAAIAGGTVAIVLVALLAVVMVGVIVSAACGLGYLATYWLPLTISEATIAVLLGAAVLTVAISLGSLSSRLDRRAEAIEDLCDQLESHAR